MTAEILARFQQDVAEHGITILRNDDVYRHIRFSRPGTSCYHFDLITWPGVLCYTGDMGTYVFSRTRDMFDFFRNDRAYNQARGRALTINLGYWSEKLLAVDGGRNGGKAKEFDEDKFKRVINEYRVNWMRSAKEMGALDKEGRRELWESVDDEVMRQLEDGGDRAQIAAYDFSHTKSSNGQRDMHWSFQDLFEHDFTEYTHHFVWCCYALAWGIEQFDKATAPVVEEVVS
jgi:hypothetical protein